MVKQVVTVVVLAVMFGGCGFVPKPTNYQLQMADYGDKPSQAFAERASEQAIRGILKDPTSAHFSWQPLVKAYFQSGFKHRYAWMLSGTVNAKNSYGGYAGRSRYTIFFRGERIVAYGSARHIGKVGRYVEIDGIDWGNENLSRQPPN